MTRNGLHLLLLLFAVFFTVVLTQHPRTVSKLKSALKRLKADTNKLVDSKILAAKQRAISAIDSVIKGVEKKGAANTTVTPAMVKIETIEVNEDGMKVETLTTKIGETNSQSRCPFPWILAREDMCLWAPSLKATWREADAFCRVQGTNLAMIRSHDEAKIIELFHPVNALCPWVGLFRSKKSVSSKFAWSNGSVERFRMWANGQPNGKNHLGKRIIGDACAVLCQHGMVDMPCDYYQAPFICQKKMDV